MTFGMAMHSNRFQPHLILQVLVRCDSPREQDADEEDEGHADDAQHLDHQEHHQQLVFAVLHPVEQHGTAGKGNAYILILQTFSESRVYFALIRLTNVIRVRSRIRTDFPH